MNKFDRIRQLAEQSFAEHEITTWLDDGIFRSYRCQKPGTWIYGFDVTFTPGWVFVTGDIGELMISRETDMLPWLRGVVGSDKPGISLDYLHEKVPRNIQCREWCEDAAMDIVDRLCEDHGIDKNSITDIRFIDDRYMWDTSIMPALMDIDSEAYEYGDACDWSSTFLWCVMALRWLVRTLDGKPFFSDVATARKD